MYGTCKVSQTANTSESVSRFALLLPPEPNRVAKDKAVSVNRQQTVEEAFEHILRTNLSVVEEWEPIALAAEDIEGVHQVRVGLRRMRSALTVFAAAIPRRVTRPLAKELRWAAKVLDRARDLDVYIAETFASAPPKKSARRLRNIAKKRRKEAYGRLRKLVQGKRYLGLKDELTSWLDSRGWREQLSAEERKGLERKVTPFASRVLEQHRMQVLEHGNKIDELNSEKLHQLRIDCKKLRYATEFFAPLYGERMQDFTEHLKALQDLLGTLHDTAVMTGLQRELLKGSAKSKLKRMAQLLQSKRENEAKEVVKALMQRWKAFSQAERPWVTAKR